MDDVGNEPFIRRFISASDFIDQLKMNRPIGRAGGPFTRLFGMSIGPAGRRFIVIKRQEERTKRQATVNQEVLELPQRTMNLDRDNERLGDNFHEAITVGDTIYSARNVRFRNW